MTDTKQRSATVYALHTRRISTEERQPPGPPGAPPGTVAVQFLRRLRPQGPWVLTAIHPERKGAPTSSFTDPEQARRFITAHNGAGENVYYSVNPTKTALLSKASKDDIARIEYLHADADPSDDETPQAFKARMIPKIEAFPYPPTFVIDSGNGFHLLWRLQEPVEVTGPR
jgi:hypothetical protein